MEVLIEGLPLNCASINFGWPYKCILLLRSHVPSRHLSKLFQCCKLKRGLRVQIGVL